MDDDSENMCPLCVLPFNEQDSLFRPCPCGFRICSWCWHKITDSAGEAGESTVDTVAKCPNCRLPYDVAATLEQQDKNNQILAMQNKAKPKRKAVAAKQAVADNVYIDGKSVVLRNIPSDTFFPLVLRRLRDKHIALYQKELAATHGISEAPSGKKRGENDEEEGAAEEDDDTYAAALIEDSSDEEGDGAGEANFAGTNADQDPFTTIPTPFPFAQVPPARNKKDLAEILKTIVLHDHLTTAEDQELVRLIVDRRNDYPYQHVYSVGTDRLEHLTPYVVVPTLEQLQHQQAHLGNVVNINGTEGNEAASQAAMHSSSTSYYNQAHSPIITGYPPRAPTLSRFQLQALSRYESDLWSWVEHFLPPPEASPGQENSDGSAPPPSSNTIASSTAYFNHRFFDSWVPQDASSRTARRALLTEQALRNPLLPPQLVPSSVNESVSHDNPAAGATADGQTPVGAPQTIGGDDGGKNDNDGQDDSAAANERSYRLVDGVAAPPLFSLDDTLAALTVDQIVADLPILNYSVVEQLVATATTAHKIRGGAPTTIGGFVSPSTFAAHGGRVTVESGSSKGAAGGAAPCVFPTPVAILSSVIIVLLHRRRQWHRWVTELVAASDSCVRSTLQGEDSSSAKHYQQLLRHLLPPALRQVQIDLASKLSASAASQSATTQGIFGRSTSENAGQYLGFDDTPEGSKAYLLGFGTALTNYLGLKEGTCLTNDDRHKFLRSFMALGRYGTVTDMDIYLQECQLLLNVKPDVKQYRKALQMAAAIAGEESQSSAPTSGSANKGAKGAASKGNTKNQQQHHQPTEAHVEAPKERKWPEELLRTLRFKAESAPPISSVAAAAFAATKSEQSNEVPLLPCQFYWVSVRFGSVGEAAACVIKSGDDLFPSWLGLSAAPVGANTEDIASATRSPKSPSADGSAVYFSVTPTHRISLIPRRPILVGLVPTRYCGSYLKQGPCKKHFCVELHADVSSKNAIVVNASSAETIVKMAQKTFFGTVS